MQQPMVAVPVTNAADRHRAAGRRWLRRGAILFAIGPGPLLLIVALSKIGIGDPNPNPVGPGILAMFTFYPALAMLLYGGVRTVLGVLKG